MKYSRLFPFVIVFVMAFGFVYSTLVFAKNNETTTTHATFQTPTQASIDFRKTVGVDPAECATTQYIIIYDGSVTYCFQITNTGPVTLTVHDLTDSELGTLLNDFSYTLSPGASYFFTQTAVITQNTVNTATWVASNPDFSEIVSDTDSATVYLLSVCPLGYLPKRYESAGFSTFPPPGWEVTNTTTACSEEPGWTNSDPGNRTNLTGANGSFAIADAEACGAGSVMTTTLTTVPMNFTGMIHPQFFFFMDYKDSDPNQGSASVQVSTDDGANWSTLFTWNEEARGPQIIYSNMPGAGEENVQMRWNLTNAGPDTWWEIDNATFVVCGSKAPDVILSPHEFSSIQPPDVQTHLTLDLSNIGTEPLNWRLEEAGVSNHPSTLSPEAPGAVILYDQTDLAGAVSIPSQEFPASQTASTHQAADDFVIPAADGAWAIYTLFTPGAYLNNAGQIPYVNVYFYADANGLPGQELFSYLQVKPQADTAGDLSIDLPAPVILPAGTYWVSVQAKTFSGNAQWGWTERTAQANAPSAWRNPGGGLSTPCTDWGPRAGTCGIGTQPDMVFQLRGLSSSCVPANVSWLNMTPVTGTLGMNASEAVTVTLDSTGLANGFYSANTCLTTNDPAEPFITLPVELTVVTQPALIFEKTVGTNPAECATTDFITIFPDTDVTYCYHMTNTGPVTITTHDLVDDHLGTLLTDEPLDVGPGASVWFTVTTNVHSTVVNVATWTGYTIFGIPASGTDSALVAVIIPTETPTLTKTPSLTPTPIRTSTFTPTATGTETLTPTVTNTPTPSMTPTTSSTSTTTATPTNTASPTSSPTPSPTYPPGADGYSIFLPLIFRENNPR